MLPGLLLFLLIGALIGYVAYAYLDLGAPPRIAVLTGMIAGLFGGFLLRVGMPPLGALLGAAFIGFVIFRIARAIDRG